jgi:hypothetical protein
MIFSAARRHGRASSLPESYMVDDRDDNAAAAGDEPAIPGALTIEMARNADLGATRAPLLRFTAKLGQRPSAPATLSVFPKGLRLVPAKVSRPKSRENGGNYLDFSKAFFQSGM